MSSIIYTAAATPQGRPDGIAFSAKGIKGFTPTNLASLHLSGFPTVMDTAYEGYKNNIAIFLAATSHQRRLSTQLPGVALESDSSVDSVFNLPPMTFKPTFALDNDDKVQRFVKAYALYNVETMKTGKTTFFIFHSPNITLANKLLAGHDTSFRCPPHTASPADIQTMYALDSVLKNFLRTQTYAAFTTHEETEEDMEGETSKREVTDLGACRFDSGCMDVTVNLPVPDEISRLVHAAQVVRDELAIEGGDPSVSQLQELVDAVNGYTAPSSYEYTGDASNAVLTAKYSSMPYTVNIGPPADVPRSPGNLFPYFERMLLGDKTTLKKIFFKHFTRCLADDIPTIVKRRAEMRKRIDDLADTPAYVMYAHLFTGIDLALETQTRMYVVRERGEYLGFCLLGYEYTVAMQHLVFAPATYQQLAKALKTLTSHSAALEAICEKVGQMKLTEGGEVEPIQVSNITCSGQLADEFRKRDIAQKWYEKEVVELLGKLRFDKSYQPTTAGDIVKVLSAYCANPTEFPPVTTPLFIPTRVGLLSDPLFCRLAVFGPEAVSPMNARGVTTVLPKRAPTSAGEETLAIEKDKLIPKVILARKPLAVACEDWKEMMKTKAFTQDVNERAQASRCLVFKMPLAESVQNVMSRMAYEIGVVGKSDKGKRKDRGADDEEGQGPSKKAFTIDDFL